MGKRRPGLLCHPSTSEGSYATHFEPFSPWIHREFIALCYLRFTGVGSFLSRCLVEEQASGPLIKIPSIFALLEAREAPAGQGQGQRHSPPGSRIIDH